MGAIEIQNANEYQQLLEQSKFVIILFYQGKPFGTESPPQLFSRIAGQFPIPNIALGQVNVDRHLWVLKEAKQQAPIEPPCLVAYRNGTQIAYTRELDPTSATSSISGIFQKVKSEA